MRRSLGGLLLLVAGGFLALAIGTFWLDRVAFTPSSDTDTAYAVMGDEDIRRQVATLIASVDGPTLGMSPADLRTTIEQISRIRAGAAEMRTFIGDAHAVLIGDREEPAVITAAEQVQIVRDEHVALSPVITLPVDEVGSLSIINTIVGWTWLISFGAAVLMLLLGLFLRPERGEFMFAFGLGSAATGVMLVILGFIVPAAMLPALSDDPWTGVFPRLANLDRGLTFVGALVFVSIGALATFGTSGLRQRRQRSTPLATTRYREQQRWSR